MPQDAGAPQASAVPNLAELISARKAERGWTYQHLAARANDVISRQRWQQLGTGVRIKEFPEPSTIQSIADALEVDVTLVVLAVAKSIGLAIRQRNSSLAAMLPPGADQLTEQQRDAVLAVVRAMSTPVGANDEKDTQPRTQEGSSEHGSTGGGPSKPGAPNTRAAHGGADNVTPLTRGDQGTEPDHTLPGAASRRVKETVDFDPNE